MKGGIMKNVIFVIGVLLSWYGCSDDNTGYFANF